MVVEGNPDTKKRFKGFHTLEQHLNDLWGLLKYRWMVWGGRPPVFDAVGLSRGGTPTFPRDTTPRNNL